MNQPDGGLLRNNVVSVVAGCDDRDRLLVLDHFLRRSAWKQKQLQDLEGALSLALHETDSGRMEQAVHEAEEAILFALAARLFRAGDSDRLELQDALNNLRALRESASPQCVEIC